MQRYYNIAGLNIEMNSFGRTVLQAKPYEIDKPDKVDMIVSSDWNEVKTYHPEFSDSDGEYLSTSFSFYNQLLNFNGFRFHSSAVVVDNKAYLFSADSGTGKSTHTALWKKLFGDKAFILNDDKPALRLIENTWYAYGTPWSGKNDISVNASVPVAGIAMLERAKDNQILPFYGSDAIRQILAQSNRPRDILSRTKLMELLDKLISTVPIWKLRCNMDSSAALTSYEAMSGEKFKESQNA